MKTILSFLCCMTMVAFITSCDNGDSGGSSGGGGDYPQVSFLISAGDDERIICYNADNYSLTTAQICTWNCAYYNTNQPQYVQLTFNMVEICEDIVDADGVVTGQECQEPELLLVHQELGACRL